VQDTKRHDTDCDNPGEILQERVMRGGKNLSDLCKHRFRFLNI